MYTRIIILISLITLSVTNAFAQPFTIKGNVTDTVTNSPLHYASITILHAEDSVLETFTRTREDGTFQLQVSEKGQYIIMSVFPGFAEYVDKIDVNSNKDLGLVPMTSKTHLLQEFVYTDQYAAIKVKGDTVEYIADSFKVKDNATVESLLKKLPGLQVDKDGNIQAHGQKVEKLLVDGEEFFTDDPAVVSKSLQAKAVDKVQVFDKKSDEAEFTGIDDGQTTRTVNLQLKDNMKRGYFGKVVAAGGKGEVQNYFENQAMFNAFKGKRKLSAFGIVANTGKIGLGWDERDKFGGGNNTTVNDDGSVTTYYSSDDELFDSWDGQYNGRGYPKAWTGGLHYSNKWNEDKHHLGGNYRYAKQNIESINNTLTQYILPNSEYFQDIQQDEFKTGQRHKVDGLYEYKLDSLSDIKFNASGDYTNSQNRSNYAQSSFEADGDTLNTIDRQVRKEATKKRFDGSLLYRKKFNKKRRTLTTSLSGQYVESDATGFTLSNIRSSLGDSTIDQQKKNINESLTLNGYTNYTEPLSDVMAISVNYRLNVNNSTANRNTFNKGIAPPTEGQDAYTELDSTFSNNYAYNIVTHTGGTTLSFDYKDLDFSFGGAIGNTNFHQLDLMADTTFDYNVINFFPRATLRYKISKQTNIRFNYDGSTNQPTIQQIQPLRDNTDPSNIAIGNAGLTQEFRHSFRANLHDYKVLSGRWIWMSVNYSLTDDAITRSETIDTSTGLRTYQYENTDGNYSAGSYFGIGKRIVKLNMRVGGGGSFRLSRVNTIVNNVKNTSNFNSYSGRFNIGYDTKDEKFEISFNSNFTYNDNSSSISTQATSYWTTEQGFEFEYELPWKLEIGSDINWFIRQRTEVFDRNNNVLKWNAHLSKKFLKNEELELRASVFDILNQNLGFNRFAANNYITENSYNTIRRYGMISLIWNFTKMGAGGEPEQDVTDFIN